MKNFKLSIITVIALGAIILTSLTAFMPLRNSSNLTKADREDEKLLSVRLDWNRRAYSPGETVEYSITLKNEGDFYISDLHIIDNLSETEEYIKNLKGKEAVVFKNSYKIPEEFEDEYVENKVIATGEMEGQEFTDSDSFEIYMERFSSIEFEGED